MILKIAWRNLWRNKRRSVIVLTSVVVGVAMLMFNDSLMNGMVHQMLHNQIKMDVTHTQIHKTGFRNNKVIENSIDNPQKAVKLLENNNAVKAFGQRVISFGLVSSASNSGGVAIYGVNPEKEKQMTDIYSSIIDGKYLGSGRNEIIIGKKLAEKLDVMVGDKMVAIAADIDGEVSSELFRVAGIFKTASSEFDKSRVYVSIPVLQNMLSMGNKVSEIAVILEDYQQSIPFAEELGKELDSDFEVSPWQDIIPMLVAYSEGYRQMVMIFYLIIGLAVIFGVINTMLMSVFERVQEFGVLMSIGMKNGKIFRMVLLEAFMLGITGTFFGMIAGYLLHLPIMESGIDLSLFSESMASFGMNSVIHPRLSAEVILNSALIIPVMSVLAASYPAWKAIKLQPTEAMRYV